MLTIGRIFNALKMLYQINVVTAIILPEILKKSKEMNLNFAKQEKNLSKASKSRPLRIINFIT